MCCSFSVILVDLSVCAILASDLARGMARPTDKDFLWTAEYYDIYLDTPIIERFDVNQVMDYQRVD